METIEETYRCQFCGTYSPAMEWDLNNNCCPDCGEKYDPLLAQEEEDE